MTIIASSSPTGTQAALVLSKSGWPQLKEVILANDVDTNGKSLINGLPFSGRRNKKHHKKHKKKKRRKKKAKTKLVQSDPKTTLRVGEDRLVEVQRDQEVTSHYPKGTSSDQGVTGEPEGGDDVEMNIVVPDDSLAADYQVCPLTQFFLFPFLETLLSLFPPSNSLVSVSDP